MARHKPLAEQVIVITGASSGIGLATAEAAVRAGAKVVLAARSEAALNQIAKELAGEGDGVIAVGCDVADRAQVDKVVRAAIEKFGRIDTWVNNAGISIYGRMEEVSQVDSRRVFDTNFWGTYNGSLAALPHLKASGGTLINVGSEVSDAYVPLMGIYTASKHAVKGFTDALRVELEYLDKVPISITLIQPTAVDTPFPQHARNYMNREPSLPDPQIEPQRVANAILEAAVTPARDKKVGATSILNTAVAKLAPSLADNLAAKRADQLQADEPPCDPDGALHRPSEATGVVGQKNGRSKRKSDKPA